MTPVGIVYSTEQEDYLYVTKLSTGSIWIGQGNCPTDAVTERSIYLDRKTAKALAKILAEEAQTD